MDWLDALIMGIVQGLAEYLPISSSGHLEIFHQILGLELNGSESLQFDIMLHVATVLSTIVVLWREFVPLVKAFFTFNGSAECKYVYKILLSCIPVAIVGLCFKDQVEKFFGGGLLVVGVCLCITALLLALTYFSASSGENRRMSRPGHDITWVDAIVIGIAQAVAVLPGLSRSGTTIATGLLLGDKRDKVAQFSFFMVIIPILGEALLDVKKMLSPVAEAAPAATEAVGALPLTIGFLASFIVGCLACKWMLEIVKRGKLIWFAVYCLIAGAGCIIYNCL